MTAKTTLLPRLDSLTEGVICGLGPRRASGAEELVSTKLGATAQWGRMGGPQLTAEKLLLYFPDHVKEACSACCNSSNDRTLAVF
jgi:hypothetical protein